MGIPVFDAWAVQFARSMPIGFLKDSVIGVDATYFLQNFLDLPTEPLKSALGGWPLALETKIVENVTILKGAGIKLHFVFNGLDYGLKDELFKTSISAAATNAKAFELYEINEPTQSASLFSSSGIPTASSLSDFLKMVLHKHKIDFSVAPFGALAQLAYYERDPIQFIDAIYGPSDVLLYGVEKYITDFELKTESYESNQDVEPLHTLSFVVMNSQFHWIDRRTCLEALGNVAPDVFISACLLAGSDVLQQFPPLENPALYPKGFTFRDVVHMIMSYGRTVAGVCSNYQDDPEVKNLDYLDRYRRTITGIRYHVVITKDGNVAPLEQERAPSDLHECLGQRLPEELNMYLSRGLLRPRVLNWLTSGSIVLCAPVDGGDSPEYQNLIKHQLDPWRRQALCLLSDYSHRYYQRKDITTKLWFDQGNESTFNIGPLLPSPKESLSQWHVKDDVAPGDQVVKFMQDAPFGTLFSAIQALTDTTFVSKSITSKPSNEECLKSPKEITRNVVWRFLQLRGYVNPEHQLTTWGNVLLAALAATNNDRSQDEAIFVAVELLRLDLLNADTMFPDYSGAPRAGSEIDRRNCMLVSRVACLGKLRHQAKRWSGPLSRHLLAYHSIISDVKESLRDLIEMCLVTMFLAGDADRERHDWMNLRLNLPFYMEESCALGIAVKTYLDELCNADEPTSQKARNEMRKKGEVWVKFSDFHGSLDDAFRLWDAVYQGVKKAGNQVKNASMWHEVDEWLAHRR